MTPLHKYYQPEILIEYVGYFKNSNEMFTGDQHVVRAKNKDGAASQLIKILESGRYPKMDLFSHIADWNNLRDHHMINTLNEKIEFISVNNLGIPADPRVMWKWYERKSK